MCHSLCNWFKQKRSLLNSPIHPVFLKIKNKEQDSKFTLQHRKKIQKRVKVIAIICWVYLAWMLLTDIGQLDQQILTLMWDGVTTLIVTLIYFLSKFRLWLVDFCVLSVVLSRSLSTIFLFKFTYEARSGFENLDIKQLQDSLVFAFFPIFLATSTNWKMDFLLTSPIFLIVSTMTTMNAFSTEGDNMSCFAEPE